MFAPIDSVPVGVLSYLISASLAFPAYLVCLKEGLDVWGRVLLVVRVASSVHHPLLVGVARVEGRRSVRHHPQDGEVVAGLVALAAALVLVVDDVFADVAVNVLVTGS